MSSIVILNLFITTLTVAQYIPGNYGGSVDSRNFNDLKGKVSLQVYLSGTRLDSVDIIDFDFDVYHKIHGPLAIEAKTSIPMRVISEQSVDVDGITGATISSNSMLLGIARAVEKGIEGIYKDGTYSGSALGRKDSEHTGIINIRLIMSNNNISRIEIDSVDQATDHKRWGYFVQKAIKEIPDSVLTRQSLEIDAISQATNTSNAILLAIARALEKAIVK